MARHSAGILLFTVRERAARVLLVHPGGPLWKNKDAGAWSLPKGEYARDEDPRAAALRELREETGLALGAHELIDLGEVRQQGGKAVTAFAAEHDFDVTTLTSNEFELEWPPRSGRTQRFPEVDRAQWFAPDVARGKIIPAQSDFIETLLEKLRERGKID